LTVGKEYLVLGISVDKQTTKFRVISDDAGVPILAWSTEFDQVSGDIPSGWVTTFGPDWLILEPATFSKPGFWEHYFEGDHLARADFDEIVRMIERELSR
jgi:hypothetical protein